METLLIIIVIAWVIREGVQSGHKHWQGSKAANRVSTRGQGIGRRAASAARHDFGYWLHQVLSGFPQTRTGLAEAWHAGRRAQAEGHAARQRARTGHLETRARLLPEIRDQRRRQAEALAQIRDARQPEPVCNLTRPTRRVDGQPETEADRRFFDLRESGYTGWIDQDGHPAGTPETPGGTSPVPPVPTPAEGNAMPTGTASGDTTYHQQMAELTAIRADADDEVASVRRKRMLSRLDVLTSLGLDSASLSEAAAIDDALREQQKAAQQTLDAADAAISGLKTRHGGIQEAVDSSPVAQPAQPEFYAS